MAAQLSFVKVDTNLRGLMRRAMDEWERYRPQASSPTYWVFVEDPQMLARSLEVLAPDLPERDLGQSVRRMPYLIVLFAEPQAERRIPFDALFGFLSVLNRAGMVTLLRQSSDRVRLAPLFGLEAERWNPFLFMLGGVPDIHAPLSVDDSGQAKFF